MAPIIVLGMHKSGTSLVSMMLHRSGISMVDAEESGGYDDGNHFERTATNALNKRMLGGASGSSIRTFERLDESNVPPELIGEAKRVVDELERQHHAWGFKDPRTCLTYPLWKQVLPRHKLICVYRAPAEVHAHYTRKRSIDPTRGIRTLRAWYEYNLGMLDAFQQAQEQERLLLDYGKLMQDDVDIARLARFVGRTISDVRDPRLRRARSDPGPKLRLEAALLKLATGRDVTALAERISAMAVA